MKTLIELFDTCQVENAVAGLILKPERIIYVGFGDLMNDNMKEDLKNFFLSKGVNSLISFEAVERDNLELIVDKFNYILDTYEDCCFDLTGGKEIILTAIGVVSASRKAPMFQFDVRSGQFINIKGCENVLLKGSMNMSIMEAVKLNGCIVNYSEPDDVKWSFSDEFKKDIENMWSICKVRCGTWNRQVNMFDCFEGLGNIERGIRLKDLKEELFLNERIINDLIKYGLIYDFNKNNNYISFKYKNSQVKKCLTKAGNIFELYCYLLLKEISDEKNGCYDDIDLSIYIDWDGIIHRKNDKVKDTKNEVDIMVIKNSIPIFISCKSGEVHKEALYELETIAKRFGGKYAKKVLFATYVDSDKEGYEYIKQRAKDMNIKLIDKINDKEKEELKTKFIENI